MPPPNFVWRGGALLSPKGTTDLATSIKKLPSPEVKPAIQSGCGITILSITGLDTGLVSGKANANLGLSPKLSPALKLTNL